MESLSVDLKSRFADVEYNYKTIKENISNAAVKCGRNPDDIIFLSAVKTVPPQLINYAAELGLKHIGENKVQELLQKYDDYALDKLDLQFIGHLQTNKVRQIVDKVSMIQSVDSFHLAEEISKRSMAINKIMPVLIEVNIGQETSKSGVFIENIYEVIDQIRGLSNIKIKGIMSIPPIFDNNEEKMKIFNKMYNLFIDISQKKLDNVNMEILSMGMSDDYMEAIQSGSNLVRIGSALFGKRIYK